MSDWFESTNGENYIPFILQTEEKYSIPTRLLCRIAYQESSWIPSVVSGEKKSSAGCIGLMQLNPVYFPNAGMDWRQDVNSAAELLVSLCKRFAGDYQVAVAAYNWGGGNVHHEYAKDADKYVLADMPEQTQTYVREVFADVPLQGALLC